MHKQLTPVAAALALLGLLAGAPAQAADNQCAACHANVAKDHAGAAHKDLACTTCHTGTEAHLKDMKKRPAVNMDPAQCGACHQQQYKSAFMTSDRPARQSKKAAGGPAPDPFFDRALGGHGFTKEHDLPRAHTFMAIDQFIVDRAFGGRFEPKDGWLYTTLEGGKSYKAWDVLKDNYPDNNEQKAHKPGTAAAANGVCWSCKSTDLMLDWAYMGDKAEGAKFHRGSNPVDVVRNVQHGMNCNFCHGIRTMINRTINVKFFEKMFNLANIQVYSFQVDDTLRGNERYPQMINLAKDFKSFSDTASALKAMDVVVTVDTSVAHLSGALGVKTYLLLPYASDWRWFGDTKTTPWYKSVEIFKQQDMISWECEIDEVISRLT